MMTAALPIIPQNPQIEGQGLLYPEALVPRFETLEKQQVYTRQLAMALHASNPMSSRAWSELNDRQVDQYVVIAMNLVRRGY